MNRVIEELWLAVIFVGKWLALGFGTPWLLSVGISLAYHKSYLEPRLAGYDLEITELTGHMSTLEEQLRSTDADLKRVNSLIADYQSNILPLADLRLGNAKQAAEDLGLHWWQRLLAPFSEKDGPISAAYKEIRDSREEHQETVKSLDDLLRTRGKLRRLITNISEEFQEHSDKIERLQLDKKRAAIDLKGPVLWLIGILGLT